MMNSNSPSVLVASYLPVDEVRMGKSYAGSTCSRTTRTKSLPGIITVITTYADSAQTKLS